MVIMVRDVVMFEMLFGLLVCRILMMLFDNVVKYIERGLVIVNVDFYDVVVGFELLVDGGLLD